MRLQALPRLQTAQLITRRLGVKEVPQALVEVVNNRAEGNLFYTEELTRAMLLTQIVQVRDGKCIFDEISSLEVPISVESAILSALDRLPADQQLCLKVAAVVGHSFGSRIVRDTWTVESQRTLVTQHLEALAEQGLTVRDPQGADPSYRFRHVIMRDVTYTLMPPA
jgi:predicted ATPase